MRDWPMRVISWSSLTDSSSFSRSAAIRRRVGSERARRDLSVESIVTEQIPIARYRWLHTGGIVFKALRMGPHCQKYGRLTSSKFPIDVKHWVHLDTATVAQIGNPQPAECHSAKQQITNRLPICATLGAYDFRW